MCWLSPQTDQSQRMGSAAAGLAHEASGGACYLNLQPDFHQKEGEAALLAFTPEELASSTETSADNILSLLSGSQAIILHFPFPSFSHCQQLLLGCFEMELDRQR